MAMSPWAEFYRRCAGVTLFALITALLSASLHAQQAAFPRFHRRLPHPSAEQGGTPKANSEHGYVMAGGKVGGTLDTLDDLAIASISESFQISHNVIWSTGSVHTYSGADLAHLSPQQNFELKPAVNQDENEMGVLAMAIGDVRGTASSPATNLVFVPSHLRFQACSSGNVPTGAVDVLNLTASTPLQLSINPPELPGLESGTCNVLGFGHGLDVGDVDGDGVQDLIVGAFFT
jgi:hypothetical protein